MQQFRTDRELVGCRRFVEYRLEKEPYYPDFKLNPEKHYGTRVDVDVDGENRKLQLRYVTNRVSHFYDSIGVLVASSSVDGHMVCVYFGEHVLKAWDVLKSAIRSVDDERLLERSSEQKKAKYRTSYQGDFAYLVDFAKKKDHRAMRARSCWTSDS